jgi:alkylation response protein AidB-like acyl-CoA dehydrogenase
MTTTLSDRELGLQRITRDFVDELIPWEVEAEMNRGELPPDVAKGHHERAAELGLISINMPESMGGPGYTMMEQTLSRSRPAGSPTLWAGW